MLRWARNPLVSTLLVIAGALVLVASISMVTRPGTGGGGVEQGAAALPPAGPTTATTGTTPPPTTQPEAEPAEDLVVVPATTSTTLPVVEEIEPPPPPPAANVVPTRVRIETIGVDASMIDLYKKADNTLQVPEDIHISGWYTGRSVPGEPGPSVVVGHVDSAAQGAGVFYRLRDLEPGDLIQIDRSDGSVAQFRVTDSELVLKSQFPTDKVYGSVEGSKLRLVTCGGSFDGSAGSYLGNVIVYADHIGTTEMVVPRSWDLPS